MTLLNGEGDLECSTVVVSDGRGVRELTFLNSTKCFCLALAQ